MQKIYYQFVVAEFLQESLKSLLKDKIMSDVVTGINSLELVHIAASPLEVRVDKVPNVLVEHCDLITCGERSQFILVSD